MTPNRNKQPWRLGIAGTVFAWVSAVWFGLTSLVFTGVFPQPGAALLGALATTLPFLGIALVAAICSNFEFLETFAWPASLVLLCIVGYWYFSAFQYGVLAVK